MAEMESNPQIDSVEMQRKIRARITQETEGMSFEELRRYIDERLGKERPQSSKKKIA